jgi:hypothetical protein
METSTRRSPLTLLWALVLIATTGTALAIAYYGAVSLPAYNRDQSPLNGRHTPTSNGSANRVRPQPQRKKRTGSEWVIDSSFFTVTHTRRHDVLHAIRDLSRRRRAGNSPVRRRYDAARVCQAGWSRLTYKQAC